MTELLIYVLIIVLILVAVSEYGIEGAIRALIAGMFIVLAVKIVSPDTSIFEGFEEVSSGHVNSSVQIPDKYLDERRVNQAHIDATRKEERALALDNLFGPPAMPDKPRDDLPMSIEAKKYYAMADGEYGRDHQWMDEDTDLAYAVEVARRGRMITEQAANMVKATPDTWKDIYEPELRATEESTLLRL